MLALGPGVPMAPAGWVAEGFLPALVASLQGLLLSELPLCWGQLCSWGHGSAAAQEHEQCPGPGAASVGPPRAQGPPARGWPCQHPQGPPAPGALSEWKRRLCQHCLCSKQMQRELGCDKQEQFIYRTAETTIKYGMYAQYKISYNNNNLEKIFTV